MSVLSVQQCRETAVVDWVLGLGSYFLFEFNCVSDDLFALLQLYALPSLDAYIPLDVLLSNTQEVSNQPLQRCLCLNLAWSSYILTCRLYPRYSVSGFCYHSLCYKQLPLLCMMSRTESKGMRGRQKLPLVALCTICLS